MFSALVSLSLCFPPLNINAESHSWIAHDSSYVVMFVLWSLSFLTHIHLGLRCALQYVYIHIPVIMAACVVQVCMGVCVHVCMCIHIHTPAWVIHAWMCVCAYLCMSVRICVWYGCIHACAHIFGITAGCSCMSAHARIIKYHPPVTK